MLKPHGWQFITTPDGFTAESETFTCKHCNRVTAVAARQRPEDIGGLCKICMGLVCEKCVGQGCVPLEARLEKEEASYHARRSYGF